MRFDLRPFAAALLASSLVATYACSSREVDDAESAGGQAALDEEPDSETCSGLPRLRDVKTPRGVCVGIVAKNVPMARGIAQLDERRWLVTAWAAEDGTKGSIWMLTGSGSSWSVARLATNWNMPHGVVVTEDKKVFVGEPGGVYRFYAEDPARKDPPIIGGLPADAAHWATSLAYDSGFLYVNKGSASDNCAVRDAGGVHFTYPCAETDQRAQIRRYSLADPSTYVVVGKGLRNSMALAVHPASHVLIQGENGQNDLNMDSPSEELNVIGAPRALDPMNVPQAEGRHYGWPYCFADSRVTPGYAGLSGTVAGAGTPFGDDFCKTRTRGPSLLLPPHSAPLGMTYLRRGMFPLTGNGKGNLVVAYHGFAMTGHKLVVVDVDEKGVPTGAPPRDLVLGWGGDPSRGKPMGKPVSVVEAPDGALLVTDDRNGMILRVTCDRARGPCMPEGNSVDVMPPDPGRVRRCADRDARLARGPNLMAALQRDVIDSNCVSCHGNPLAKPGGVVLEACDDVGAAALLRNGWVVPGRPEESKIMTSVELGMGGLSAPQLAQLRAWIAAGAPPP
jgi:glucose/arabinose dehydrogenase